MILASVFWVMGNSVSSNDLDNPLHETPIPPLHGRQGEAGMMQFLSKPRFTAEYWLRKGRGYLGRKEYEQAILAFRKAVAEKPLFAEAHFLLAVSYENRGLEGLPGDRTSWDYLAENELRTAISLADFLPARYNLALLLERQGNLAAARPEFEHILTVSPQSKLGKLSKDALERNIQANLLPGALSSSLEPLEEGGSGNDGPGGFRPFEGNPFPEDAMGTQGGGQ